jgi:Zn-dependent protease with chaperone function
MSSDSSGVTGGAGRQPAAPATAISDDRPVYFDGKSSRRYHVGLAFGDRLAIDHDGVTLASWPYADIRRADGAAGLLRLSCVSAPDLARLEIRDANFASALSARCPHLDHQFAGRHSAATIVAWSLAAVVSMAAVIWFGLPLAADRLAPLVPDALQQRIGEAGERQITAMFGGKTCNDRAGLVAFDKLMAALGEAADIKVRIHAGVLNTPIPNAFALPGARVTLFRGLLAKAENADEIAGVLAHELGHVSHRDNVRNMIYTGGTSFLIGLLFGDVTGGGALVFASRSLINASYSREAETGADDFAIEVMHRLGRPTKPMGELMFRITGKEGDNALSVLSSHPLTEDRLKRFSDEDRPASKPPLLTPAEWAALKAVCKSGS